ncbi:uncharacterized protein K444DRAFT_192256 [Hyaloscypha bicolor E]|uniref:Uncharacterized protein n=1 Tax=Hyaloscypha bicolor E TaxID=1095630 RepID=A0A2J6SQ10_9HELO|nr:uncharacterized protein K444DRAFT_192256 [Hyaloscypha bicolor E]PMD52837.1 hypothetical protein K444DRAFT_192256 [Hyaloscypha bicolor E]
MELPSVQSLIPLTTPINQIFLLAMMTLLLLQQRQPCDAQNALYPNWQKVLPQVAFIAGVMASATQESISQPRISKTRQD